MKFILPKFCVHFERWKWNKEYRIYVSSLGNFKDEHKKIIPIKINSSGYLMIKTPYGLKLAHRLVMFTFKPIPNAEELTVDHKNHNKRDNSLENLEWVTLEENRLRADKDFIITPPKTKVEENIPTFPLIKTGKQSFSSLEDAIDWIIKTKNMSQETKKETVAKNIKKAIKNKTLYCGRKWRFIN